VGKSNPGNPIWIGEKMAPNPGTVGGGGIWTFIWLSLGLQGIFSFYISLLSEQ
jgi:hypothetical protein